MLDKQAGSWQQSVCAQDIWLDKAEVCVSMGLYQPARQLLAEAHLVSKVSLKAIKPQCQTLTLKQNKNVYNLCGTKVFTVMVLLIF